MENGNAEITGPDDDEDYVEEFATFTFEQIFGDTKENIKADADTQVISDPPNNYEPVHGWKESFTDDNGNGRWDYDPDSGVGEPFVDANGDETCNPYTITWFDVLDGKKAKISAAPWLVASADETTGVFDAGTVLVVEGNVEITGGQFYGVLYVSGNLTFSAGNALIDGVIFVDGSVEDVTEVKGTTVITYDLSKINDAFGYNPLPYDNTTWGEVYE